MGDIKLVDTSCATHHDGTFIGGDAGGSIGELIALDAIPGIEPGDSSFHEVDAAHALARSHPNSTEVVFVDTAYAVVGQTLCCGVMFGELRIRQVVAIGTIIGTILGPCYLQRHNEKRSF